MATDYTREQQAFSRACIQEALFLLMQDRPLDEITISAISERSGISRMGFYRNYKSKTDVLNDYFAGEMGHLTATLAEIEPLNAENITPKYFQLIKDDSDKLALAISAGGDQVLFDVFVTTIGKFFTDNMRRPWFTGSYADYWKRFVTAGLYAITVQWIKEDFRTPIPTLISVTNHLVAQAPTNISKAEINSDK
ncbi:TetR/AcrR family transcriptional regulator [Lacticaseibacillus hulanensis]|uniref:TetR/AcrR family transcriptional regulator n=1 Tax=Lacticaseibacillus hulanensis TaxID=2493111 RepID=UPI0013E377BA|nr:TetR/AcrR family transcriptional regulator [Lacticaseibacillus hulanensis]